ncbi:hypothetical protein [Methylobacterium gnaphalii]|uniref:DUF308 domain-containing protein n=1 Tax=Methylobacterium gnaphalii TaxID=1010610 RepID=A0A512JGZ5_9HYPH|nr:hypothetical protein [Methylobacterium gnaphalii]GEP09224.1 hypothetical protein MGN01_10690 [Methylobacterium gnaphalii]GJD67636.1 hypothetical protein MMMDOFMJ_0552 [Methylobacterium gnaphalii]GLS49216.1 hypothetical protein GCM10007885_20640 [Methylobacterium gnaphalii]
MIIALFALSLVMIVGGIAAVVQGFPYVRLESGQVLVIGGATAASAGAVLLGIAVALMELRRLFSTLRRHDGGEVASEPALPMSAAPLRAPSIEETSPLSAGPATATAGAAGLAGVALGSARDLAGHDHHPSLDSAPSYHLEAEPPLPDLLSPAVPSQVSSPAPDEPISPDEDLFASPEDRPGHGPRAAVDAMIDEKSAEPTPEPDPAQEELALRPALEEPALAEPEPAATDASSIPEEPAATETEPLKSDDLQVVGTYSSGANTYVMFANGTIQADTPRGQFTFQSLDELKAFVDSGGETSARGAA